MASLGLQSYDTPAHNKSYRRNYHTYVPMIQANTNSSCCVVRNTVLFSDLVAVAQLLVVPSPLQRSIGLLVILFLPFSSAFVAFGQVAYCMHK